MRVSVENLSFSYRDLDVLHDLSFSVQSGTVTTVLGPNGVGKSTLLRILAGVSGPNQSVTMGERPQSDFSRSELRRTVGYMTQANESRSNLSVFEVVLLGRVQSLSLRLDKEDLRRTSSIIEELRLGDLSKRPFGKLSGGQQRMVFIAQVLVGDPRILILDEPTANLDLQNEMEVLELIRNYTVDRDVATVMTLHDLNQAARCSDRLLLLKGGRKTLFGRPEDVLSERAVKEVYGIESRMIRGDDGDLFFLPVSSVRLT